MWRCSSWWILRVALHEARQQALALEVARDEPERGEAERALDHHVVGGHEVDLGAGVAGVRDEPLVRLDQRLVEDLAERGRELLAGAGDVRADRLRIGDHLVLEARVELHVARLVDLLGGEERGLLLAAVGHHQPGELGGDPLLGDHQRRQRPEHQPAVVAGHLRPLLAVGGQVDVRTGSTARPPSGGRASADRADARRGAVTRSRHRQRPGRARSPTRGTARLGLGQPTAPRLLGVLVRGEHLPRRAVGVAHPDLVLARVAAGRVHLVEGGEPGLHQALLRGQHVGGAGHLDARVVEGAEARCARPG